MAGQPNRIYRSLDKTSSSVQRRFFLACHSDPAAFLSRRHSLDTGTHIRTHVHTPIHPEFHPRDIFLPRHVQRAAQRSVASLCSFPSSPRRFFLFFPVPSRPASHDLFSHSLLFSALPFVAFCSFGFASDRAFFAPPLTFRFRLATSRAGSSGSVSKVSPILSKYVIFSHFSDSMSQKRIYT